MLRLEAGVVSLVKKTRKPTESQCSKIDMLEVDDRHSSNLSFSEPASRPTVCMAAGYEPGLSLVVSPLWFYFSSRLTQARVHRG